MDVVSRFWLAHRRPGRGVLHPGRSRGDSPEDQLLVQFQGMFAEYEKAQIMERYRRDKAHRARDGSVNVNVLGRAPFGYRYVAKTPHAPAAYQVIAHEAVLVRELFRIARPLVRPACRVTRHASPTSSPSSSTALPP